MASTDQRLQAQIGKLQSQQETREFEQYKQTADAVFARTVRNLIFYGAQSLNELKNFLAHNSVNFAKINYLQVFVVKMSEMLGKVDDDIERNNVCAEDMFICTQAGQVNTRWAWHIYWHEQRFMLSNLLIDTIQDSKQNTNLELKGTLASAHKKSAESASILGKHYSAIFIQAYEQMIYHDTMWWAANFHLTCSILHLTFLQHKLDAAEINLNLYRILLAKRDLLLLCAYYDHPERIQYQELLHYINTNLKTLKAGDDVQREDITCLKRTIGSIVETYETKNQRLPAREEKAGQIVSAQPAECPYTTALNPVSFVKSNKETVERFLGEYQGLLGVIEDALALQYKNAEQRSHAKQELAATKRKVEIVLHLVNTRPEFSYLKSLFDLLEMNLDVIADRMLAIDLLEKNEAKTRAVYLELIEELEPAKPKDQRSAKPTPLATSLASTDTDEEDSAPTSHVSTPRTASSHSTTAEQASPQPLVPAFIVAKAQPKVKALFEHAFKALREQNNVDLALAFMARALPQIKPLDYASKACAHAFLTDCLLIKVNSHAKFHPRIMRGGIFTRTEIVAGKRHFVIVDILNDLGNAINNIKQALTAIEKLAKPYSAAIEEILLGLNIVKEDLISKVERIRQCFELKLKEREEIRRRKQEDGSWYTGKPRISLAAQFFAEAINPNTDRIQRMQAELTAQAQQINFCLQKEARAAAAAPAIQ